MNSKMEKRQLIIFGVAAYALPYLLGILMWYGYTKQIGLAAFPNAQMMYPAMGVMLAFLLTRGTDREMPKAFYRCFIGTTAILVVLTVGTVFAPEAMIEMPGGRVSACLLILQYVQILGSLICLVCLIAAGKKKREAYGLRWKKGKASVVCILLFLVLYFLRVVIAYGLGGQLSMFAEIMASPQTWIIVAMLPLQFLLAYIAFFGEEYGWRYYLQPILQEKFGLRPGVLLLGLLWGLWHLPLDIFFYVTPDKGLIMVVSQIITCVGLGIFFGYAYMKTENIWVPVIMHFLNNNLVLVISGTVSADVMENQNVAWSDIPLALVLNGVLFGVFILAKEYRRKE
jgi:membrane protease YdiL (CAAX protease family)